MRVGSRFIVICLIIGLVISSIQVDATKNTTIITQESTKPEQLVCLNNAKIDSDLLGTFLIVEYSWFGGASESDQLRNIVGLLLSKDNMSWIEVKRHTIDENERYANVTKVFKIYNSFVEPFPFDMEKGDILYISIGLQYDNWSEIPEYSPNIRLFPITITVSSNIIRAWYFTIDWTLPGAFGAIFLCLFAVFLMSRHHRLQIEKEIIKLQKQ